MRRVFLAAILLLPAALISSGGAGARPLRAAECLSATGTAGGSASTLVAAANGFGFRLFDRILSGHGDANVFLSPASAALVLDMIYAGARGGTRGTIARTLGIQSIGRAAAQRDAATLLALLQSADRNVQLEIASSLWARMGVPFRKAFVSEVQRDYGARVSTLDFSSPGAPGQINAWVSCATHGAITSIVDRIPAAIVMYLINAVYFHGTWSTSFDPHRTHLAPFTTSSGAQVQVPEMVLPETSLPYFQGTNFQALGLPYGTTKRFSMVIVLPKPGLSLRTFAPHPSLADWKSWTSSLQPAPIQVALPRFKLTNNWSLNGPLSALGMKQAFGQGGNFTGICTKCQLSFVRQKTYLSVDEKGTTAAGATSGGISVTAIGPSVIVNHPFFVGIRDGKTGAILFVGAVNNPVAQVAG